MSDRPVGLKETHAYDDILHLPRPVSAAHPPMSPADRAAQFSPFAALTGYEAVIAETGRYTENAVELTDEERERLSRKLSYLAAHAGEGISVTLTVFLPDPAKPGGSFAVLTGRVKRLDPLQQLLTWEDGTVIPFDSVIALESEALPPEEPIISDADIS